MVDVFVVAALLSSKMCGKNDTQLPLGILAVMRDAAAMRATTLFSFHFGDGPTTDPAPTKNTRFAWAGGTCPRFAWAGGTFSPVVLYVVSVFGAGGK